MNKFLSQYCEIKEKLDKDVPKIKRYEPATNGMAFVGMVEMPEGTWVKLADLPL